MNRLSIKQISYKTTLLLSMLLFFTSYLLDILMVPSETETIFVLGYTAAILVAALWAILNYIDHLRINPLYKNYSSTKDFVKDLTLPKDEKIEIQQMMDDYVQDQIDQGADQQQAIQQIIQQFKSSELPENHSLFYLHNHKYLVLLGAMMLLFSIMVWGLKTIFPVLESAAAVVLEIMFACYGVGFWLSFAMYHLLNKILIRKENR